MHKGHQHEREQHYRISREDMIKEAQCGEEDGVVHRSGIHAELIHKAVWVEVLVIGHFLFYFISHFPNAVKHQQNAAEKVNPEKIEPGRVILFLEFKLVVEVFDPLPSGGLTGQIGLKMLLFFLLESILGKFSTNPRQLLIVGQYEFQSLAKVPFLDTHHFKVERNALHRRLL